MSIENVLKIKTYYSKQSSPTRNESSSSESESGSGVNWQRDFGRVHELEVAAIPDSSSASAASSASSSRKGFRTMRFTRRGRRPPGPKRMRPGRGAGSRSAADI